MSRRSNLPNETLESLVSSLYLREGNSELAPFRAVKAVVGKLEKNSAKGNKIYAEEEPRDCYKRITLCLTPVAEFLSPPPSTNPPSTNSFFPMSITSSSSTQLEAPKSSITPAQAFLFLCAFRQYTPIEIFEMVVKALFPVDLRIPMQRLWGMLTESWRATATNWNVGIEMCRRKNIPAPLAVPLLTLALARHGFQQSLAVLIVQLLLPRQPELTLTAFHVFISKFYLEYQAFYTQKSGEGRKKARVQGSAVSRITSFVTRKEVKPALDRGKQILVYMSNCVEIATELPPIIDDLALAFPLMTVVREEHEEALLNLFLAVASRRQDALIESSYDLMKKKWGKNDVCSRR